MTQQKRKTALMNGPTNRLAQKLPYMLVNRPTGRQTLACEAFFKEH
jgi:hypothetical protein